MALYKQEQPQPQNTMLCHTGCTVSERVMIHLTEDGPPTQLGIKKFHCVRRFMVTAIKGQCDSCKRDMTSNCFYIFKQYYSSELVDLLIKVYSDDAKSKIGGSTIWKENPYYGRIILALKYPHGNPDIKQDHYQKMEEKSEVMF